MDLQKQAELISISHKLDSVAEGLLKIINETSLNDEEKEDFEWVGNLVGQIDEKSKHYEKYPELSVLATELRPEFYEKPIGGYLNKVYTTLKSKGENIPLSKRELNQSYTDFLVISSKILRASFPQGNI